MNVTEIFEAMREKVAANPTKIANMTAAYQFELSGEGGGTFHAVINQGKAEIGPGPAEAPGCTVVMSAADFLAMVGGKLNPTTAFMTGKLKINGDMGLAMKLQSLIS